MVSASMPGPALARGSGNSNAGACRTTEDLLVGETLSAFS
jgi:hypothetical protein